MERKGLCKIMLMIFIASSGFFLFQPTFLLAFPMEANSSSIYISVPFHYQIKNYYCGPAALEMVFDYYGEDISQTEIADVARTYPYTTYTDELVRAVHFSNISISLGEEMPSNIVGYTNRKVGYAAFERHGLTIDDLKVSINKGEPLIILMCQDSHKIYGHYRVVIGYNNTHIIMHDPWNKSVWGGTYGGANISMAYSIFLDLWKNYNNWGFWLHPWNIELKKPNIVSKEDNFKIIANITYPAPFYTINYLSSFCNATIKLSGGLELALGETIQHSLGNISAGGSIQTSWLIHANKTGISNISITVTGIVKDSVGAHGTYSSYNYEDKIGGFCVSSLDIIDQHSLITYDGQNFLVSFSTNSIISSFIFNQSLKQISFNVTGLSGIKGYCNITIPKRLIGGSYIVLKDGSPVVPTETFNVTHTFLYLIYTYSAHKIEIIGSTVIPEVSSMLATTLLLIVLVLTLYLLKRRFGINILRMDNSF